MAERQPFIHEAFRYGPGLVRVRVAGYLEAVSVAGYLDDLASVVTGVRKRDGKRVGLLFCDELTGFDAGKVAKLHGDWFVGMGDTLAAIAVLSKKSSVRFGVVAAKLVVKRPLDVFDDEAAATRWLAERQG